MGKTDLLQLTLNIYLLLSLAGILTVAEVTLKSNLTNKVYVKLAYTHDTVVGKQNLPKFGDDITSIWH